MLYSKLNFLGLDFTDYVRVLRIVETQDSSDVITSVMLKSCGFTFENVFSWFISDSSIISVLM